MIFAIVSIALLGPIALPAPFADRWIVQDTRDSVEIYAEFNPGLADTWKELEHVRDELQQLLDVKPSNSVVQFMLFSSRARYQQYLLPSIPEAQFRRAVFYKNGDVFQVFAFRSTTLWTDLRHEYTHVLLHQHLQFLPLWIDEGLAEFLEERPSQRGISVRLSEVKLKSRLGWSPSLIALENLPSAADMTADDYRDSWAWVRFLLNESPETRQILTDYLRVISRGEAPGPFSSYLGRRDSLAQNRIKSYFRRFQIPLSSAQGHR